MLNGDQVNLNATGSFADRNVGIGKLVTITINPSGTDAANYSVATASDTTASITTRALATWLSSGGGAWSDPSNWDYLPDGQNVASVLIPAATGPVTFDAAVGATSLQAITNQGSLLIQAPGLSVGQLNNSGNLNLGRDLALSGQSGQPTFSQTGGSLGGTGSLTLLNGSGTWSDGVWSGGGQVVLSPGTAFTISGDTTRWDGRTLVVQGGSGEAPAAALTISGSTTATGGSNSILNAGITSLSGATLAESGGSLALNNSGSLIANGASAVPGGFNNSGGTTTVASGSLSLSGGGSDSGGSYRVNDGALLVWSGGSRTLLGGTSFDSSGSGRYLLNGGNLTAIAGTSLAFNGALLVQSGSLQGSGSLVINGSYGQSGGQLNGFTDVAITQLSGPLRISGTSINQSSIVTAPGGSITLTANAAAIEIDDTGLDARGTASGGTIALRGSSTATSDTAVRLSNASLRTSATGDGSGTTGGVITINGLSGADAAAGTVAGITISGSLIEADPPAEGGSVTIDAGRIGVQGSTLNVVGSTGGDLRVGSLSTRELTLDSGTTILLGPGGRQTFTVGPGGTLINNAQTSFPLGPPTPTPPPPPTPPNPNNGGSQQPPANDDGPTTAELRLAAAVLAGETLSQPPIAANTPATTPSGSPALTGTGIGPIESSPLDNLARVDLETSLGFANLSPSETTSAATGSTGAGAGPGPGLSFTAVTSTPVPGVQARETFLNSEATAQRNTAEMLGLADAGPVETPTPERLQSLMQSVQAWLRERERQRRCRLDPNASSCRR